MNLPCDVARTFQLLRQELGNTFSLETLLQEIAAWRGKPIVIDEVPMPAGITGYCLGLRDVDLVSTRRGLDTIHHKVALLHELAHLALRHLPLYSAGPETPTYEQFQQCRNEVNTIYRKHTEAIDGDQEYAAELLATLLLTCVTGDEGSMPRLARELHGAE